MEKFYLEKPSIERKKDALEYIKEILANNKSDTDGTNKLKHYIDNYEEWITKIENDEKIVPSEESVPSKTYFFIRESDNKIIGMTHIRLTLNKMLADIGGHIGYNIRPSERQKGYNKIQLYLALIECQKNGLDIIMIDCLKDNLGSSKTIISLGGFLVKEEEKSFHEKQVTIQDYNINVDESLENYKDIYEPYVVIKNERKNK
ncbi:MAG: GNAT family N-acetyltransferase [Lactobacillales bacterium]|nr:GNAT family N-acetyltransferase [Lactobacillales bacterium]